MNTMKSFDLRESWIDESSQNLRSLADQQERSFIRSNQILSRT